MRNRLLQLLAQNRRPFEPVKSKIVAQDNGETAIYLYDPIVGDRVTAEWWGGICPQDFVPALRQLKTENIRLYTNCPGGDVFASEAICQALREHPAHITMQIEGYAASAATSIACACDEVVATSGSKYMIHKTWTMAIGNDDELSKVVDLLRNCDESMYERYMGRTGQPRDQIVEWCKAETWFNAEQALEHGFIDSILEAPSPSAAANRQWNLSAYLNAPQTDPPNRQPAADPDDGQDEEPAAANFASEDHRARQAQRLQLVARL
ncbi:head maturation protease, ClpP-related [Chromobacterium haemolyticum]|uniref:head maturation protease, ClpP-related n=1 Tax=Chromobacterium haemolyticum TaxID=394935 RepID=UPI0024490DCB|nr:head maturation protease, ClpP-related [Chromobacterium haemolyticum]MDH0342842.1 Clp protease ClpP [Chromobacterium haemolyticum]